MSHHSSWTRPFASRRTRVERARITGEPTPGEHSSPTRPQHTPAPHEVARVQPSPLV